MNVSTNLGAQIWYAYYRFIFEKIFTILFWFINGQDILPLFMQNWLELYWDIF